MVGYLDWRIVVLSVDAVQICGTKMSATYVRIMFWDTIYLKYHDLAIIRLACPTHHQLTSYTVCPRTPFYIISYFIKWVKTSWTDGK